MIAAERFRHQSYTVRTKVFKLFGGSFDIYAPDGSMVLHASQKAFKLKEDIRRYSGKDKTEELLVIKARSILDFASAYDVEDSVSRQRLGALKRRGWKSMVKDEWIVMDHLDNDIGKIKEDNLWLGLLRRLMAYFVINPIPQQYHCEMNGATVCTFKQNFNPLVKKIQVEFPEGTAGGRGLGPRLEPRMSLAAAILLCAIEGKQVG